MCIRDSLSTSDNGVANDVCANADNITNTITCEYFDVTTTTTDACPESFSLACLGGNYNTDATVWMEFTVPAGVTSMNIRNVTPAAAFLSIFSSCTPGAPITNGGCINGAGPTTDIKMCIRDRLQDKARTRKELGVFIIEGGREIKMALEGGFTIQTILYLSLIHI